jgi:sugar/nucleoside kinase (ribokinase family)
MAQVTVVGSHIVALVMDVDRVPLEGETVVGRNYHRTPGGKGSNMAACAARLGADTTFLGKIGRDAFGEEFLKLLEREGVRRHAVLFSDRVSTAVGFVISDYDAAQRLSALGVEHVVLTCGDKGLIWACHSGVYTMPALPVNVLDTVGAGDALNAGLAVGLSEGKPMLEALALGVATASLSTRHRETIASYPRPREEVEPYVGEVLQRAQTEHRP